MSPSHRISITAQTSAPQAAGFERVRSRKLGASSRQQDPLGAGLYIFRCPPDRVNFSSYFTITRLLCSTLPRYEQESPLRSAASLVAATCRLATSASRPLARRPDRSGRTRMANFLNSTQLHSRAAARLRRCRVARANRDRHFGSSAMMARTAVARALQCSFGPVQGSPGFRNAAGREEALRKYAFIPNLLTTSPGQASSIASRLACRPGSASPAENQAPGLPPADPSPRAGGPQPAAVGRPVGPG